MSEPTTKPAGDSAAPRSNFIRDIMVEDVNRTNV